MSNTDSNSFIYPEHKLYGRRKGRKLSVLQTQLLNTDFKKWEIEPSANSIQHLCHQAKTLYKGLWMEIGFGDGDHLIYQAQHHPHILFIGCEPFINGLAATLEKIQTLNISNIRIFPGDALILINNMPPHILDKIFILFPDPWPKKRHQKRRFIQDDALKSLHRILGFDGTILFTTDHIDYRIWVQNHLYTNELLHITSEGGVQPELWIETRFQKKALKEGRKPYFIQIKSIN